MDTKFNCGTKSLMKVYKLGDRPSFTVTALDRLIHECLNSQTALLSSKMKMTPLFMTVIAQKTTRERLKSALYLWLKKRNVFKIVEGVPFGFFDSPVFAKSRNKIEGEKLRKL